MAEKPEAPSTYNVDMVCLNCGSKATVAIPRGKEVARRSVCPHCGCCTLAQTHKRVSFSTSTESSSWGSDLAKCMDIFFNGRRSD